MRLGRGAFSFVNRRPPSPSPRPRQPLPLQILIGIPSISNSHENISCFLNLIDLRTRYYSEESTRASTAVVEEKMNEESIVNLDGHKPSSEWFKVAKNRREFLDRLGNDLGYKIREDWYNLSRNAILSRNGEGLLSLYGNSLYRLVQDTYPDFQFHPWLFTYSDPLLFKEKEMRKRFVEWLVKRVGVKSELDLTYRHFIDYHGAPLIRAYERSPLKVINSLKDDLSSQISLKRKSRGFWMSREDQKAHVDSIGEKIGVRNGDLSPWYNITFEDFVHLSGTRSRTNYQSLYPMLSNLYPEFDWDPKRFSVTPRSLMDDPTFIKSIIKETEEKLNLKVKEDWYRVSLKQLSELGNLYVLARRHGTLFETLQIFDPETKWDETKFINRRKVS